MSESRSAPTTGDRLAKVMARSGLCSRRDAELWIAAGRVSVNGKVVKTPAFNVTERDKIAVDGKPLAARQGTRVWLYHKPPGLVVTEKDPEGRPTIFEALNELGLPRVLTVGRLDINTEGLLLLTNDGGLKRVLELPATGWLRRYRVRAHGSITQAALDKLEDGIEVDGVKYGPIEATLEREQGHNVWLVLALREGKNREVKNVLGALGLEVNRLIRVSYGPFQLGDLAVGAVETVKDRVLQDQLGERLASEANADFISELPEPRRAPDRPGRDFGKPARGGRAAPAGRPGRFRDEEGPTRKIHFDDGRAPAEYKAKPQGRKKPEFRSEDDKPARSYGKREERPAREERDFDKKPRGKAAGDKPFRSRGEKPLSDRPRRSHSDRPDAREAGEWTRKPRAPRSAAGFDDRSAAPKRSYASKPHGAEGGKPRSRSADASPRPARRDGAGPARGPRPEGAGRPAGRGPRPEGGAPRSSTRSPRGEGAPARGPRSDAPPRGKGGPRGARPEGAPKGRGGPRKDGGPSSGPRTPRPGGGAPRGPRKPRG
ncbi:hypothetical protein GCM10011321_24460 [Youhaiella tibetensis]|uniref:Pseudouridine synthase n=1 Tax=Paradevosia tibetensis TaxID=1447062 RepID=A0A5B9DKD5_9HYPH|nr:pseudouridine synthase [Youhaiella tibetensis]AKR54399.1 Ribosomal large subunit pseudouridine synthase B [Devosia sp. H5989]QEE19526.1 pseudouridine synthase [Youhaiella tibetensis]GGF32373.1 hypothetical protein GCM10011321_24460 [Youhaiella tibetensis]